jgi:hypothetical protein
MPGKADPVKKYWWLILVVVPLSVALVQYGPSWRGSSASGESRISDNQFNGAAIIGDVSVVVNEAAGKGVTLDEGLIKLINEAVSLSSASQHAAAAAKIEQVRASSSSVSALPSLLNSLGAEQLRAGNADAARKAFEEVLAADSSNRTALDGLHRLPAGPLKGIKVVNFSSEYHSGYGPGKLVDDNPSGGWISGNGNFPQSFVFELPVESDVSELSFNNVSNDQPEQASKDVEISFSTDSPTAGFEVVGKVALANGEIGQGVRLSGQTRARWIKLRILSNYGHKGYTQLGDVQIIGRPR